MDRFKELESLELELVDPQVRTNVSRIDELLSDEFQEFGSSGRVVGKKDVMNFVSKVGPVKYELSKFKFKELSSDCILVTYNSVVSGSLALRSSIWVKYSGTWKMLHHQATVVPNGI